jgi:predicted small lipoprotein YifL
MSPSPCDLLLCAAFSSGFLGFLGFLRGSWPVGPYRRNFAVALVAVAAALSLAACGRKGNMELPPGPTAQPPLAAAPATPSSFLPSTSQAQGIANQQQENATAQRNGFDSHGNPVATPGARKPFLLDPILN